MKKVAIICASSNKNKELAASIAAELEQQKAATQTILLDELGWELYSTPKEAHGLPEGVGEMAENLKAVDAMVFVAPEYNGGVPPCLPNFLAWISRSSKDWRGCFNGKPAAIGTHSGSGGIQALIAMRTQLSYLGMNVLGRQIHTHMKKPLSPETLTQIASQLVN